MFNCCDCLRSSAVDMISCADSSKFDITGFYICVHSQKDSKICQACVEVGNVLNAGDRFVKMLMRFHTCSRRRKIPVSNT